MRPWNSLTGGGGGVGRMTEGMECAGLCTQWGSVRVLVAWWSVCALAPNYY